MCKNAGVGFWRAAWEWLNTDTSVTFAESAPRPIDQVIVDMMGRGAASAVGRTEALSVPAVQRGRNLICSVATLPLVQRRPNRTIARNPLFDQLDPDVPNIVTLAQTLEDLLFDGIAWWRITAFGWDGFPSSIRHLDPSTVSLDPPAGSSLAPLPSGQDPRGAVVYVDGRPVPASEMIRFDSPNPAVLTVGGRAIRRAILLDRAASTYADDPQPAAYFTPAEGADPADDDDVRDMLADWKRARKERSTAYVPAALRYNGVPSPSPRDLQLVELQKQSALEIANAFGVDPEDLGVSTTSRTYANVIDRRRDRINDVLAPYMRAVTDRLSMQDVTKRGYTVEFRLDDYLKSNPTERWGVYKIAHEIVDADGRPAITLDEIREAEGWAALPADVAKPKTTASPPPVVESEPETVDAADVAAMTFAEDGKLHFADLPVSQFSVDRKTRTIEGLALPYGQSASKYGREFQFLRGALKWSSVSRVKLLRDHDFGQALGKAINLTDTSAGLRVKFKVARGAEGDRALELAEDGVLDGLSVGVDFSADDTEMQDDVMLVRRADLREVSLTAMPAFDDARVTSVTASRTERNAMECTHCGQVHAEGVACPTNSNPPAASPPTGISLSQDQVTALLARPGALDALVRPQTPTTPAAPAGALTLSAEQLDTLIKSGGIATLLGMPQLTPARPEPEPEQRQTVNPVRRVTATVNEPAPYRFDRQGNLTRGQHDFSTDLIAGSRGDGEALERAQSFMRAQFADVMSAQFDTDMADAAALNPNRNRPDMYVDQQEYMYPIWNAISKGTLPDATPFVVPKFSTASGLVAAHVEGTEPTPGVFTATAQTITPTAVSGKVEITREAWEQGGSPQLSGIIWRQMTRAWFESLEASAVTLLDGLTPTGITLTTAAVDSALVDQLTAALAELHYVRGGFRMRDFPVQIDLYKALVDAAGTDGRKLLPVLSPSNATGSTDSFFGAVMVGGLRGVPAWALAASGVVPASSYLFDREDVHGWASAPQRLQFEYRVAYVDVAIWGYKATACTDVTGVREIIYDPVV